MPKSFDRDVLVLIHDVGRLLRVHADRRARSHGMTRAQWVVLVRVELQPGLSQNELAALLEVEPITVARLVDRLQKRGLVERRPDAKDRRIWRLHLLPAAQPIVEEAHEYRAELNAFITQGMPPELIDTIVDGLLRMKTTLTTGNAADQAA
ncbi:MarR family transcriptional regulator [Reyranella sp. CPCC 100927]|nr:MarR family transcriptional regulator [Reyranella sp. CPCC 100927]